MYCSTCWSLQYLCQLHLFLPRIFASFMASLTFPSLLCFMLSISVYASSQHFSRHATVHSSIDFPALLTILVYKGHCMLILPKYCRIFNRFTPFPRIFQDIWLCIVQLDSFLSHRSNQCMAPHAKSSYIRNHPMLTVHHLCFTLTVLNVYM